MDEILSPIYQTTEKTVVQSIVMMGEQGIAFASHSIGGIESHGGLVQLKDKLSPYGVIKLGLFGSTVREENTPQSNIDILIDFQPEKETFQNFMAVCEILENFFKKHKVDIVTYKGLSPFISERILKEVEYV